MVNNIKASAETAVKKKGNNLLIEEHIAGFFLGVMLLLGFINIISRCVSGFSFAFTEEVIVYLFVASTYLAISSCVYRGLHLSVTLISDIFKKRKIYVAELIFEIINLIAVYVLFSILAYLSVKLCIKQVKYDYLTPVLQMPTWIFTSTMVIGSIAYIIRATVQFVQNAKRILHHEDEEENLVFDGVELNMDEVARNREAFEKQENNNKEESVR
jgi:TRAP-type C4-dicarboxylate transport system, small permease component